MVLSSGRSDDGVSKETYAGGYERPERSSSEHKSQVRQALVHGPHLLPGAQILLPDVGQRPCLALLHAPARLLGELLRRAFRARLRCLLPGSPLLRLAARARTGAEGPQAGRRYRGRRRRRHPVERVRAASWFRPTYPNGPSTLAPASAPAADAEKLRDAGADAVGDGMVGLYGDDGREGCGGLRGGGRRREAVRRRR
ncbi:hypothetical protein GSI_15212 [Ganoderma sinense ZZ0214-1]|uniref:Uncharacterized protein n=1 Tax=Ganoderma sinense ZZ0214-1 TaxID=1077348 RepID=A0A2G8RLY7_9APHY|nr:hypothetical protein GSI_15212 [Ganoderma sinense ZZ0214-1]